jgi:hypothetical protein
MAFNQNRRFGGGSNVTPMRGQGPARAGGGGQASHGGSEGQSGKKWTSVTSFYDAWHSALEPQVVTEFFKTGLALKLSPVFPDRAGPDNSEAGKPKYDHEAAIMVVLNIQDSIMFRHQLEAFLNGSLSTVDITRGGVNGPVKRILLTKAEDYYDASHPAYQDHAGGLAFSIEQEATDREVARSTVFISRPSEILLADGEEPIRFFPELQALLAVVDSYINNCARVDFGSVRLLENINSGSSEGPRQASASTTAQPVRRSGPNAGATANRGPAPRTEVSDDDIGDALGGGAPRAGASSTQSSQPELDDVLAGDGIPNF